MNRLALLGQIEKPIDRVFAIGRELSTGSSPLAIALVFAGVGVFFILLYILYRLQIRSRRKYTDHSGKLFTSMLVKMNMGVRHRDLVRRVARDLGMENPTIMFLTPELFLAIGEKWLLRNPDSREQFQPQLEEVRHFLFPEREKSA